MTQADDKLISYRVLDLTSGGADLAGRLLADLGADVIKVEPPEGSDSRRLSPFAEAGGQQHSLFFEAYNAGKQSLVANIATSEGREQFLKLVASADAVIESFEPGYLDSLGLGFDALSQANPQIVLTSITPFGQTGPKAKWAASDLTVWASSGPLYLTGDPDRAPVQISFPYQASLIAGSSGAYATLLALRYRNATGKGQQSDVSMQEAALWVISGGIESWDMDKTITGRYGIRVRGAVTVNRRQIYDALDGYVAYMIFGGVTVGKRSTEATVEWMRSEGVLPDILDGFDWEKDFDLGTIDQDRVEELELAFNDYFRKHDKRELSEKALANRIMLTPVTTPKELAEHPQYLARDFFVDLPNDELGGRMTYAGGFAKSSLVSINPKTRAPKLGEHDAADAPRRDAPPPTDPNIRAPLSGVKVANFGGMAVAPLIARQLALFGATVVRVESFKRPDMLRLQGPFLGGKPSVDTGVWFPNVNAGALSIGLDMNNPSGLVIAHRLAAWADVIIENYPPGTVDQWGIDYESVKKNNPGVIYLSTSLLGQNGPYKQQVGIGFQAAAMAGFTNLTGFPDRAPTPIPTPYTDFIVPAFSAAGIVAALERRDRTGEGQYFDQSQSETAAQLLAPTLIEYLFTGRQQERNGNRHPDAAPHGVFQCQGDDRWIAITCMNDEQFQSLGEHIGNELLDPKFKTLSGRKANEGKLESFISGWTDGRTAEEAESQLQEIGVPASVVANGQDVIEDVQLAHRKFFRTMAHSVIGPHRYRGPTFRLSAVEACHAPGPALGEHNAEVCEILGVPDEEVAEAIITGGMSADIDLTDIEKMRIY